MMRNGGRRVGGKPAKHNDNERGYIVSYQEFLRSKMPPVVMDGFVPTSEVPDWFLPHQADCVHWAIRKGRAALFESFGG